MLEAFFLYLNNSQLSLFLKDFFLDVVKKGHQGLFEFIVILKVLSEPINIKNRLVHDDLLFVLANIILPEDVNINLFCIGDQVFDKLVSEP